MGTQTRTVVVFLGVGSGWLLHRRGVALAPFDAVPFPLNALWSE